MCACNIYCYSKMFAALALRARKHLPVPVSVSALKLNQRALKLKRIECRDGKEGLGGSSG